MRIPSFVHKCVAFVGAPRDRINAAKKDYLAGTCFILLRKSARLEHMYVITARHVVNDTAEETGGPVFIRANTKEWGASWMETQKADWVTGRSEVDVAVLPVTFNSFSVEFSVIPGQCLATKASLTANKQTVEIGEELAIPGLFVHHYGAEWNIPIVRMGTVAALAEEPLTASMGEKWEEKINAYLIESRSIGGLSGSPVLMHRYDKDETGEESSTWSLLGLMQGHYDAYSPASALPMEERVNMGIGIVVTADDIDEVLSLPDIMDLEKRVEDESLQRVVQPSVNPAT